MNPQDPSTPSEPGRMAVQGSRPVESILGELMAAAEVAINDPLLIQVPGDTDGAGYRLTNALRNVRDWLAFNVAKKDPFAMDLVRALRCAQAARPRPFTEDRHGK